jgi:beta-phosphoglucomutase-like phosphatase (HAD superfamily)
LIAYFSGRLPLYLASATPHEELALILEARKLTGYFKDFFGAPKSKAQSFSEIARRENVKPQKILFIGDSAEDHRTAVSFGCRFLARRSDHPPTPDTGISMEEGESGVKASADVRHYLDRADEPGEAKDESTLAKTGHKKDPLALAEGLHNTVDADVPAYADLHSMLKIFKPVAYV